MSILKKLAQRYYKQRMRIQSFTKIGLSVKRNENNTAPYNKDYRSIIRLGSLSCEPCEKNVCIRYGTPQCLERLDTNMIVETVAAQLQKSISL
jgi:hypothetical protein